MTYDFEKARRLSRIMSAVTGLCGLAVAAAGLGFAAIAAFDPEWFGQIVSRQIAEGLPIALTPAASAVVAALTSLQLAILLAALYCLWRMFNALASDEPLSARSAVWMRRAGGGFLFSAVSGLVIRTGVIAALTLGNPPGQRMIAISLGSSELLAVLMAGVLLMVGHILATAAEIQDDNRAFV
jgi:hypothetical protein